VVLTFAELVELVRQQRAAIDDEIAALTATLAADPGIDLPEFSRRIVELCWSHSGLSGPAAVVSFGSLYYPPAHVTGSNKRQARLRQAVLKHTPAVAEASGTTIGIQPFFPGISDMSFLGGTPTPEEVAVMAANTPAYGTRIRFDYTVMGALDLPTINVGPWGRDYHQRTERVNMPYSFGIVPELIWRIANDVLGQEQPPGLARD
jgi:arginine utilization protein RocB